jgi:hypothetical protein
MFTNPASNSILFSLTTTVSAYYLIKFRKDGLLPYESKAPNPHHISGEAAKGDNAVWSTEIETGGRRSDDDDRRTEHGGNQQEDEYALLHSTETDEGRHPGRPLSWGEPHRGGYGDYRDSAGPDALSPGGYEELRREAAGADARLAGHGGSGYSFGGGER